MATMVANFTFKGLGASVLREQVKNYLIKEFVARRNVFVDLVNPMYEKWNKEFYELYPGCKEIEATCQNGACPLL